MFLSTACSGLNKRQTKLQRTQIVMEVSMGSIACGIFEVLAPLLAG